MRKRKQSAPERSIARTMSPNDPPHTGDVIEVYWSGDKRYYRGSISQVYSLWSVQVSYDDGDIEDLNLSRERWRYIRQSPGASVRNPPVPPAPPPPPALPSAPQPQPSVPDPPPLPNGATSGAKRIAIATPASSTGKRPRTMGDLAVLASEAASEICRPILEEMAHMRNKVSRNADGIQGAMIAIKNYFESRERATRELTERVERLENALRQRDLDAQRDRLPSSSVEPQRSGNTNLVHQQNNQMKIVVTPNIDLRPTSAEKASTPLSIPTLSSLTPLTSSNPKSSSHPENTSSKVPASSSSAPMPLKLPVIHEPSKTTACTKTSISADVGSTRPEPVETPFDQAASKSAIDSSPVLKVSSKAPPESDIVTSDMKVTPLGITEEPEESEIMSHTDKPMKTSETSNEEGRQSEPMQVDAGEICGKPSGESTAPDKPVKIVDADTVERAISIDKDARKEVGASNVEGATSKKATTRKSGSNANASIEGNEKLGSAKRSISNEDREQPLSTGRRSEAKKKETGRGSEANKEEDLLRQVDDVMGHLATKWLLEDTTRPPPPAEDGNARQQWAVNCSVMCYSFVSTELEKQKDIEAFHRLLNANLGQVSYDWRWLLDPSDTNIGNARRNYKAWEPVIRDGEWLAEQHVLREMARRFSQIRPQYVLPVGATSPDALYLAVTIARQCAAPQSVPPQ